jgi:nicotinamidase-related amidase
MAAKALSLPRGPLTETAAHLWIDVQRMFAEQRAWHVPWMKRVLPVIVRLARASPPRTMFTRFILPVRAADAEGMWRQYYQR